MLTIVRTIPAQGQHGVPKVTNFLLELTGYSGNFTIDLVRNNVVVTNLITNNIFNSNCRGMYSIIKYTSTSCIIIIDNTFELINASYHFVIKDGISSIVTQDFIVDNNGKLADSNFRHTIYSYSISNNERRDNIPGFKFDETYFASEQFQNNMVGLTSLWDARTDDLKDGAFQSGIGYGDDIKGHDKLTKLDYSIGSFEKWSLSINHGIYYIDKYYNHLYSKDANIMRDFDIALSPFAHSEISLTKIPKASIPILLATYSKIIGNYIPSYVIQRYKFTSIDTTHNTFCCKYCDGSKCLYSTQHLFDSDRYLSDTMGKDYSSYYDNTLYGRCDNTDCPGHRMDNVETNILWDNVSTTTPECIYVSDTNKIICNVLLENETYEPKFVGYTNGAKYQWIDVDSRYLIDNSVTLYIAGTPITNGFDVDLIGGRVQINHDDITPYELRNTYGYAIQIGYKTGYSLIYEPEGSSDTYIPTDINLNPLYSGITRGFVSMLNTPLYPDMIYLTTAKASLGYTVYDSVSGDNVPVYGPLYIGNDYGYITAKVMDKSGMYGIPNVNIHYRYSDYGTSIVSSPREIESHTNAEGVSIDAYTAPVNSQDQLVFIKLTSNNDTFGTTTTHAGTQDTIVLPYPIPRQCIVNDENTTLIDIFAVYKNDPVLGKVGADVANDEVEWVESGSNKTYRTNGRKEVLYKWIWDNQLIGTGHYTPITPTELGGTFYLYDEDNNICVKPTDMVKKIVYADTDGDSITTSLLPHNTDTDVGAYCITVPRYVFIHAEMDIKGFNDAEAVYTKSSNRIAFEVRLPDYMRGVFKMASINSQDAKSLDGATYLTVDPMAIWDLSRDQYDPRTLAHTFLVQGNASVLSSTTGGIPLNMFSLRQLIYAAGTAMSNLRHIIAAKPVYLSQLRQLIFAGNYTESKLRHIIQAVKELKAGFDFTLNVIDPPSGGFDVEFNMVKGKQGGVSGSGDGGGDDPTNPINIEFTPSGALEIVSPNDDNWNRYGNAIGGDNSNVIGYGTENMGMSDCVNNKPTSTTYTVNPVYILVYNIPEITASNKNTATEGALFHLCTSDPYTSGTFTEANVKSDIGLAHRYLCRAQTQPPCSDDPNNDNFYETWQSYAGGKYCLTETNLHQTKQLYAGSFGSYVPVARTVNGVLYPYTVLFKVEWACEDVDGISKVKITNVDANNYVEINSLFPLDIKYLFFNNNTDDAPYGTAWPWWYLQSVQSFAILANSDGTPMYPMDLFHSDLLTSGDVAVCP